MGVWNFGNVVGCMGRVCLCDWSLTKTLDSEFQVGFPGQKQCVAHFIAGGRSRCCLCHPTMKPLGERTLEGYVWTPPDSA